MPSCALNACFLIWVVWLMICGETKVGARALHNGTIMSPGPFEGGYPPRGQCNCSCGKGGDPPPMPKIA